MFTPLSPVITTALAAIFLQEELHIGSFLWGIAIIAGLCVVLRGKAEDARREKMQVHGNDLVKTMANRDPQSDIENTQATPLLAETRVFCSMSRNI
ncbi:hypothetical protein EJB05_43106, partial [Eragrostis curvula]